MKGLKFRKKKAAAFGCYGWSGESVKTDRRDSSTRRASRWWTTASAPSGTPIAAAVDACVAYGKKLAEVWG